MGAAGVTSGDDGGIDDALAVAAPVERVVEDGDVGDASLQQVAGWCSISRIA